LSWMKTKPICYVDVSKAKINLSVMVLTQKRIQTIDPSCITGRTSMKSK